MRVLLRGVCHAPGGVRRPRPRTERRRRRRTGGPTTRVVVSAQRASGGFLVQQSKHGARPESTTSSASAIAAVHSRARDETRGGARRGRAPLRRPRVLPMSARESSGHVTLALVTCAVTLLVLVVGTHWQHQHPDDYFDEAVAAATREKTARLTNPQCRACETLLGAVEWHEPWWYESRAAWDWARSKSLPGVYDDEDYAEAYSLRMPRHPRSACGFHKMTPREARHVMRGRTVLFIGNSISRRLMYAVADAMGGGFRRSTRSRTAGTRGTTRNACGTRRRTITRSSRCPCSKGRAS